MEILIAIFGIILAVIVGIFSLIVILSYWHVFLVLGLIVWLFF